MSRGLLITFEGMDGVGKTTQVELFCRHLVNTNREYVRVREPGGTPVGEAIRTFVKTTTEPLSAGAELLLFSAARAVLFAQVIEPALAAGKIVVCDRFIDSTMAYQGYGRNLGDITVFNANFLATGGVMPDKTILLECPRDVAAQRRFDRGDKDRFDGETEEFMNRVEDGFDRIATNSNGRVIRVRSHFEPGFVHGVILNSLAFTLANH